MLAKQCKQCNRGGLRKDTALQQWQSTLEPKLQRVQGVHSAGYSDWAKATCQSQSVPMKIKRKAQSAKSVQGRLQ